MLKEKQYPSGMRTSTRVSPGTNKYVTTNETNGPRRSGSTKPAFQRHTLSFDHAVRPAEQAAYQTRKDMGLKPTSRVKAKRDNATTKALIGEHIDKNVKVGDELQADPTTKSRGRLYRAASGGALKPNSSGGIQVRRSAPNRWQDVETNLGKNWNPAELKKELKKLADSAATRVGRRAGGTSKVTGRISKARNQLKVKNK